MTIGVLKGMTYWFECIVLLGGFSLFPTPLRHHRVPSRTFCRAGAQGCSWPTAHAECMKAIGGMVAVRLWIKNGRARPSFVCDGRDNRSKQSQHEKSHYKRKRQCQRRPL